MTDAEHKVGYCSPPIQTQWKPGQSGNPSGRPRKSVRLIELLLEEANAPVTITENGQTKDVVKLQAMVKALIARATKGDIKAMALFLNHWNPTEIAAHEWYEQQKRQSYAKGVAKAQAILAKHFKKSGDSATSTSTDSADLEWEEFCKDSADAEKEGKLLTWDAWLASKGVPEKFIGEND